MGVCYRMTSAVVEDIAQDTFVKALEKPPVDMQAPRVRGSSKRFEPQRDQLRTATKSISVWLPSSND